MEESALIFMRSGALSNGFAYIESLIPNWHQQKITLETSFTGRLYLQQKEIVPPFAALLEQDIGLPFKLIDKITYGFWVLQFTKSETLFVAFTNHAIALAEADPIDNDPLLYLQKEAAEQVSIAELVNTALIEFQANYEVQSNIKRL